MAGKVACQTDAGHIRRPKTHPLPRVTRFFGCYPWQVQTTSAVQLHFCITLSSYCLVGCSTELWLEVVWPGVLVFSQWNSALESKEMCLNA